VLEPISQITIQRADVNPGAPSKYRAVEAELMTRTLVGLARFNNLRILSISYKQLQWVTRKTELKKHPLTMRRMPIASV